MLQKPLSPPISLAITKEIINENKKMSSQIYQKSNEIRFRARARRATIHNKNAIKKDIQQILERNEINKNKSFYFNSSPATIFKPLEGIKIATLVSECQLARHKKHIFEEKKLTESRNNHLKHVEYNKIQKVKLMQLSVVVESCYEAEKFKWSSTDQGKY